MSVIPPTVPIVAERCWRNTGKYILAQGQTHRHQKHARPLLSYVDDQETPALQSGDRFPESRGPGVSYQSSTVAPDRTENSNWMASTKSVSGCVL
jgi:hypothetical protein